MINIETLQSLNDARKINLDALAQSVRKGTVTSILVVTDTELRRKLVREDPRFVSISSDTKAISPESLSTFLKASVCGYRGFAVLFLPARGRMMNREYISNVLKAHCRQIIAPMTKNMEEGITMNICYLSAFVKQ